jgi:mannose-6-phosphate isomerase
VTEPRFIQLRANVQKAAMTIEHAVVQTKPKPWGGFDLRPWTTASTSGGAIGELWYERPVVAAPETALLLKLLFTTEPLSIQVHPDDAFAKLIGLPNGKTEAWYILSATPDAQVAIGLKHPLSSQELRASIADGSIADLVQWRPVRKDDVVFIPAGTIHAIGAGIVLAEIQQRSDATFRLFDYGRQRELHAENAVAVAQAGIAQHQPSSQRLTEARTTLIVSPHFVLEKIELLPNSSWMLTAERETWILVLSGDARIGLTHAVLGDAIFVDAERTGIEVGADGMTGLLTYLGPNSDPGLLEHTAGANATNHVSSLASIQSSSIQSMTAGPMRSKEQEART